VQLDKNKVLVAMARKKMSHAALAKKIRVTDGAVCSLINNKYRNPKPETVGRLAEALDVDVAELLSDGDAK